MVGVFSHQGGVYIRNQSCVTKTPLHEFHSLSQMGGTDTPNSVYSEHMYTIASTHPPFKTQKSMSPLTKSSIYSLYSQSGAPPHIHILYNADHLIKPATKVVYG